MVQLIFLFSLFFNWSLAAEIQPVFKDSRYYFDESDTHQHINLYKALRYLSRKFVSVDTWKKSIQSLFFGSQEPKIDVKSLLNPIQSIPDTASIEPKLIWVGHSTFLIQINGFNILTDPIWGHVKVGPFTLTKRSIDPGIAFDNLPPIDAIIISHNHSDHTDTTTLMALSQKYDPVVFIPKGDKELFKSFGFSQVVECNWWDEKQIAKNDRICTFTFLPAYHWSIRFSLDSYRKSLWGSWMVSAGEKNIYFAGDTAYADHFKEIAQKFPLIDIALMPIGPTSDGENKHKHLHVNAKEAVDAFIDLNATYFVPMHYATFFLCKETVQNPIKQLNTYWDEKRDMLKNKELIFACCGMQYTF